MCSENRDVNGMSAPVSACRADGDRKNFYILMVSALAGYENI